MKMVEENLRFSKTLQYIFTYLLDTFCYTITVTPKPYHRSVTYFFFKLITFLFSLFVN